MKKKYQMGIALSLILSSALSLPMTANAQWVQNGNQWSYTENGSTVENGWKSIEGQWYYFQDGVMKTGWLHLGENWYYLDGSGAMKTGWLQNAKKWYYLNAQGVMQTGWLKLSGDWYFLNAKGVMQQNAIQVDGVKYDMGSDGKMRDSTPAGYPYYAYDTAGNPTEIPRPEKTGETVSVNLWEGMSLKQMAQRLNDKGVCPYEDFLQAANASDDSFPYEGEIPSNVFYRHEGYLFPDTYEFYLYDSAETVVKRMKDNFKSKIDDSLLQKVSASGYSLHEVLTLASIVQGEASDQTNMRKVAQVYINRLNNPGTFPKLQANPTTNYANQVILTADPQASALAAAYDTYKSDGLIPGPINNPGRMAIEAVLHPDVSCDDYFFCTDRVTKEFYYAKTWEEHKQNTIKAGLAK